MDLWPSPDGAVWGGGGETVRRWKLIGGGGSWGGEEVEAHWRRWGTGGQEVKAHWRRWVTGWPGGGSSLEEVGHRVALEDLQTSLSV